LASRRRLVEVLEAIEHGVLVDAEVDEAGDLVDAQLTQLVDLGEAALGCAEQPCRAHVALEGVVHDHGHFVGIELVEVGNRGTVRRGATGLGEARGLPLDLVDEVGRSPQVPRNGSRTSRITSSRSRPTKVCSMSVT
jgi:hypothetical protein